MTKAQLQAAISEMLTRAEREVTEAGACDPKFNQNSWVTHMTASMIFSGIAAALIEMKKVTPNGD